MSTVSQPSLPDVFAQFPILRSLEHSFVQMVLRLTTDYPDEEIRGVTAMGLCWYRRGAVGSAQGDDEELRQHLRVTLPEVEQALGRDPFPAPTRVVARGGKIVLVESFD